MARRTKKGDGELQQKVFGTPALFSTAYGDVVGSSAHYTFRLPSGYSDTPPIATLNQDYQPEQEWQ